jgi:hypothetical protein
MDDVDRIAEELGAFSPAFGHSTRGSRSASISVPSDSMRQATAAAIAIVDAAFSAPAIVCEAMAEAEADIRQGWVHTPDLVNVS